MADKTRQIYTTLKNGGADVGSYDEFHNWFYAKGKQGYQNRKNVWDAMNAGGADVGKSYEEFRDWLKLAPASRQSGSPTPARSTENIAKKTTQNGGGHAMSPSERWGFLQGAQDLVDDSAYSLSRTQRAMDYAKRNTGLKVKPVRLGENSKVVEKEPIYNPVSGTAERYYMDSEGNEHATRAQADFTQRQIDKDKDLIGYLDKQAQESIDDAFQRQYDEAQRYKEEHPYLSAFSRALAAFGGRMSGGSGGNINQYTPAEAKAGLATIALNHKTRQMIDEGKRWGHTTVLGRTLRGVKAGLTDAGTYDFGLSDTQNAVALKEAADRYEQGKATAEDEMLLAAASLSNETAAKYADALGGAYSAGRNLVGTIGFMAQIASNPASGIGKATAQKVARTVGQYAISKFGSRLAAKAVKALAKGAARVGMDAVEAGVVTGMYSPTKIVGDYAERKTGSVHANGDGTYTFDGKEYNGTKALAKAINAQNAENLSEMWGGYLPGAGKIGGRIAKGVRKIGMGKVVDAFEHMSTSEWVNTWRRFTERTKWNGTFGEYAEEFLNNFYNAITNGDMTLDNAQGTGVFNKKVNLDTLESVGLMSGIMGAANAGGYKVAKYDARRAQKKSDIRARNVFGKDRWEEIKNIIDAADAKQLGNMMEEIGTGDYFTEDQKLAVLDYQYRTAYMNGFNAQCLKNKLEGQQDMTEDSYDAGYNISAPQEKNDAKINYDLQREKLARIYGEDSAILEHIDDDPIGFAKEMSAKGDNAHAEEVLEYANAKAAYEGMIKRVQDDIENSVAESDAITDSMTHEDGNLYPATMKTDDRKVYVISGYAQMLEDGSGVDHEKSSHDIIIKDAETGKIEFTTPDQILNVDTPQDASTVKREAAENIRQTIAQASADQIDGVLPFNSGDEYAILGTDNTQHTIQILTDQGDGTLQVVVDGDTNTPMVMTKDSIQNGAKANSLARLQQAKEQQSDKDTAIARDIQDGNTGQVAEVDDVTGKGAVEQVQRAVNTEASDNKQDKDATETMPMIGEGEDAEPDFYHVVPARAHTYIYNEAGLNRKEGDAFVDANLKEAQKALEKAKKGEPVMGTSIAKYRKEQAAYQQIVDDAQRAVDYWNGVKAEQDKVVAEESRMRAKQQQAEDNGQSVERRKAESIQQDGDVRRSSEENKIDDSVSDTDYVLSDKKAENGERFYQDAKGNIDLADIPEDIFNKIGKPKAPFRLTPSMLKHVFDRHGKEMGLSQADDAIDFVLDVMDNFDHVRQGDKNAIIFSIENGRSRTGRRAVTVLLDSNSGEYYGIKTSGYERIEGLNKKPLLWEKGANKTSATGVAPANVTTKRAQQGNGPTGSASNHSTGSASKDSKIFNPVQENENIFAKAERISHEDGQRRAVSKARKETDVAPTDAQKEAGNYKKGHVKIDGLDFTMENPKGSTRSGKDTSGKEWSVTMNYDYGYLKGTKGTDGDHIDVYLSDNPVSGNVYVVDQVDQQTGKFDEHKVMYGFPSVEAARDAYASQYEKGWKIGTITEVSREDFKRWIDSSKRKTKPFAEYVTVNKQSANRLENKSSKDLSKSEKDVSLQSKLSEHENSRQNSQGTGRNRPKKLGENDAIGLRLESAGRENEKDNGGTRLEKADRERAEAEKKENGPDVRRGKEEAVSEVPAMTETEYLASKGLDSPMTDYMLDKTRIPHGETARQRTKRNQKTEKAMNEHAAQKDAARKEYRDKIAKGDLREPTKEETKQKRIDALIKTANGHEDNPSVQAARRVLEKRGIEWHEQKNEDVSTDRHGKVTQEESENFLSQRDFAEKGMLSALGQTKYKTLKEWEDKDVESYVDKYDDLIAGYTNYVESFAKDDKLQVLYDKSSVREQKKIRENIEDADLDYHDILNTSPQRLLMQDRLTRKTKYAKGEFADGTIVTGEVVNQTPESLTISYRGTKYPISAKKVLEQSDEPIDSVLYRSGDEEYTDEERGIIEHAKSDGSYMKAPNGEPTNLDEKQWAQVRTKAFKDWFGDWEKVARIEKLKKSKPVKITGEEYKGKYELNRDSAKAWIKDNLRGEYTIDDTGEKISLTKIGANKVTSHGMGNEAHLQSIAAIPQLIEHAVFIDERPNEKNNDKYDSYRYYVCGLKIGATDYTVKLTIGVKHGKKYYDHALTEIEKGKLLDRINDQAEKSGFTTTGDAPLQSYALSVGKDSKLVSILQTNSSKVLDENSEPMVVYHGTQEDFYTFGLYDDTGVQNVFNEIPSHSFLLTPDEYAAGQYGETGAFFVNAKNVLNATSKEKILDIIHDRWEDINNDGLETVNFDGPQDAVNELGYLIQEDGRLFAGDFSASELQENEIEEKWHSIQTAIENYAKDHDFDAYLFNDSARDEECISYGVFSPNQIKSATDNNGAFDAGSDDVRFRSDEVKAFAEAHHLEIDDVAAYEYAMSIGNNGVAHYALSTIRRKQRTSHRDMKLSEFGKMFSKIRKGLYEQFGDLNALDEKYRQNVFKERGLMEAAHRREEEERKKLREPIEALMSLTSEERDAEYMRALEAKDDNRMREVLQAEAEMKGYTTDVNYQGEGTWNAPANPGYKTAEERRAAVEEDIPDLNIDDLAHGYTNQPDDIFTNMRAYGNDNESGRESGKAITDAIRYIKSGKGMPKVTVYRAVPTSIKENSLRNGDWVTPSKAYAKMHGESRLEGDYRIIEQKVPADELWWDSNDIREWGFDNGKDYTYKNTENGRKLNDLVIRDDNGNVILPSQRFNDKMTDERFRTFGGNRGYVDYSKSVRAVEAEQRGLRNKSQMDKNFADKVNGLIDDGTKFSLKEIKTALKFIDADEWHHTSKMGNKTDYYSAETIADYLNSTSGRKRLRREMLNMAFRKKHKGEYWLDPLETEDGVVSVMEMGKGRTMKVPHDISKEDFAARLSDLKQGGNDTVLRSEVSENNQSSGRQGKMYDVAQDLVSKLGLTDSVTVMKNADGLTGEKAKAKGWFDTTTGKIVIVMGNHRNVQDVIQTILHEAVAHYGLRKLFGKHFDTFLDNVFKNADENVKKRITELAMRKYGGRFDVATEEYLAGLAENTDFEDVKNNGWWGRIKQLFLDMLHKIGFDGFDGISLSDNELRYILWRSYENLANDNRHRSILDVAKDIDMQNRLQVGNYAAEKEKKPSEKTLPSDDVSDTNTGNASESSQKSEGTLFRDGSEPERTAREIYEEAVKDTGSATMLEALAHTIVSKDAQERFKNKFSEAYFDYSRSIKQLQDAIEKATGTKLADYENVWWKLNAKSSIDAQEVNLAMFRYIAPLAEHVGKMVKSVELGGQELTQDDVEVYMNAVHGIERNAKMAERELELIVGKDIEKWRSKRIDELMDEGYKRDEAKAIAEKEAEGERKRLAEIHKDDVRRDYSGLTALFGDDVSDKNDVDALETAARTYADKFEAAVGRRKTEEMWRLVNELNSFSLRKSYTSGLISKTQYDQARTMYKHYVPLRGWHDDFAGDIYQYISRGEKADTLQNVLKKAYGRTSRAGNIMGTMASMANCAIVQGNKNIAAQHLLNLALNHGDKSGLMAVSEQWYEQGADGEYRPTFPRLRENMTADEKQEAIAEYEERMKQAEAEGNGKVVRKTFGKEMPMHIAKWQEQQHSVRVLRNGKEYQVYILGNPRAAQAFNGLVTLDEKTGKIWNGWLKWMRFRAAMQTSFSPEFIVSNFERDIITAGTGTYIKFGWKAGKDFAKNLSQVMPLGGVMNGHTGGIYELIRKYDKGTLDTNDDMERMFGEFVRNGGMTGVSSITKSEEYERQMATVMKRIKRGHLDMPRRAMEGFFDGVEFLNKGIENATRFAAYMTSRNMGKSVAESVFDAKEASVNFNMKGSGAWGNLFLRRTILYVNPCLQSLRMLGTWYGASPKRFMGMFGTILAASVGTAILWASIGGGDDDNDWYKLSEWNRYNFINIRIGGGYAHWSIPQELRPLWALGQISFDWSQGRITKERALNSMLTQLNNLSPMAFFAGGLDSKDSYWKTAIKAWTPTIAADFMDAYAWNEDFLGRKVTGQTEWNSQAPEWRRASKDTPEWAVAISKKWNELTGGTQNRKSWWDSPVLNPSAVYYLLKQQVGGMGTLVTKMSKAYEQWRDPDEEVEARNIPFVSKFWVTTGDDNSKNRVINDKFWMLWNEYQQTDYQIKHDQTDVKNGDMTLEEMAADLNSLQEDGSMQRWKKMHELGSAYERIKKDRNNGVAGAEDKMQELKKRMVDMMERE